MLIENDITGSGSPVNKKTTFPKGNSKKGKGKGKGKGKSKGNSNYNDNKKNGRNVGADKAPPKDSSKSNSAKQEAVADSLAAINGIGSTNAELLDRNVDERLAAIKKQNAYRRTDEVKQAANRRMLEHVPDDLSFAAAAGMIGDGKVNDAVLASIKSAGVVNKDSDEVSAAVDVAIDLHAISGIVGLPYMADNVVDPPPLFHNSELSGTINSWELGRCGRDYTKRVLERGQFLVLMPIELRPNITDTIGYALSGATGGFFSGGYSSIVKTIDSVEERLNLASYGFTAKIAAKRYWRNVQAHAKAIFYSLGIENFNTNMFGGFKNPEAKENMKRFLPDYLVNNVYATNDMNVILQNMASDSEEESELAEFEEAMRKNAAEEKASSGSDKKSKYGSLSAETVLSGSDKLEGMLGGWGDKLKNAGNVLFSDNMSNSLSSTSQDEDFMHATRAMHDASMLTLIQYVMNADKDDYYLKTAPYTVFYCNGPIDRNYSWSIETGVSKIAENSIVGAKKGMKSGILGAASSFLNKFGGQAAAPAGDGAATGDGANANGQTGVAEMGDNMDLVAEMTNEWAYHNNGNVLGGLLISNLYIPKVQQGSGSNFSYSVSIRDMALSSDRYSLARLHFTLALLLPYVYPANMPRQTLIIPTSALYCAAFSKGVINCPRAVISNMSVKTDNTFQTTFGVPTELDITLQIDPIYTQSTMPDFNKYWSIKTNSSYFLGAMWNPMSSFNMLATMCGQNTVFSKMPKGLFAFFAEAAVESFFNTIGNGYGSFRASMRDYMSSLRMNSGNYKMI